MSIPVTDRELNVTRKQKKLLDNIIDDSNIGLTERELLVKSGYSKNTADKPYQVFKSVGFRELVEKYLPDQKVLSVHSNLLDEAKSEQVKLGAVKLAYQVKGHLDAEGTINNNITVDFTNEPEKAVIQGEVIDLSPQ